MLNKKMLLSLLIIGVVSVSAGAGTWAYFSDTETSTDNTFTAGTLDLLVNGMDTPLAHFDESNLYPGWTDSEPVTVTNAGSIDGVLSMEVINLADDENLNPESEDAVGVLSTNMWVEIVDADTSTILYDGFLSEFDDGVDDVLDLGSLDAGETRNIVLVGSIAGAVGNEIQGDKVTFDIVVTLDQDTTV